MGLKILGIETSCDETAVGVVEDGTVLRSNVIASQVELHSPHGGIVPEVASRQHIRDMVPALEQSLAASGMVLEEVDLLAVQGDIEPIRAPELLVEVALGRDYIRCGIEVVDPRILDREASQSGQCDEQQRSGTQRGGSWPAEQEFLVWQ